MTIPTMLTLTEDIVNYLDRQGVDHTRRCAMLYVLKARLASDATEDHMKHCTA